MISFFPEPYKDEILYSLIARYHYYIKNNDLKDTLNEVFDTENTIATLEFPAKLYYLENALPKELGFSCEYFINNHTIFPVYEPFLPEKRKVEIQHTMKFEDGKGIKAKIGMIAGSIGKNENLIYCPICAENDINIYGEAYFHRLHQVEGVMVCPEHKCFLKKYNIKQNDVSRIRFIKFCPDNNDLQDINYIEDYKMLKLIDVANGVKYLLENCLVNYNMSKVHDKYIKLLNNKGLITPSGRIRQKKLYEEFVSFYPKELLMQLNSCINFSNEYNWLKVALRSPKRVTHPLRNILIILFLTEDLKNFFTEECSKHRKQQVFPCLNPVCKNYKKLVIKKYSISTDSKTDEKVGTFYCKCGFVYSRKMERDIFKVGRIKEFGEMWETKLKELINEGGYSIRRIALILRCDPKTVVKYADKLGIKHLLNTNMNIQYKDSNRDYKKIDSKKYKIDIKNIIKENPEITRNKIRINLNKQYIWLYKNDRQWFDNNMPKKQSTNGNNNNKHVLWKERDNILLELVKNEYSMLMQLNENKRITKSLLGRRINKLALLEKKLDKLPKTGKFLNNVVETVEDFQIRRVNNICLKLNQQGEILKKWKIIRQSGLRPNYPMKVDKEIDNILKHNII
jgi:hypothetical protein